MELLTADYTFLNERLARHYGISGVTGAQFRKVSLEDKTRFGLLGKAAVQLRTSYGDRTSPVLRGAWVLDKLMGTPPTPPPPDTATDLSQKAGDQPKTVRARLEQHRDNASCNTCHGVIDPTGLALENFDAIGQWRTTDSQAKVPIDASTVLPTGVAINGVVELRTQLVARPEVFARTVTERLLMYAVNRRLEYFDMPQVRAIARAAAKENYKLSSIVLGIVNSDAFRKQALRGRRRNNVHHEETSFAQNGSEGRRSHAGAAVPGGDGACRHGSCPNRGGSQAADGLLLYSSRRDHGEHVAWSDIG